MATKKPERRTIRRTVEVAQQRCERCGKWFDLKGDAARARFCSARCRVAAHRQAES